MTYKGIVIRITPYKEKSAMISLLTKDGLLSFLGRDIYKVNSNNVLLTSPLIYGEFTFVDKTKSKNLIFKEMHPIIDTRIYMNDFNKLSALNFINEVILALFNDDEISNIYYYLIEVLNLLNKVNIINLLLSILTISLRETGYALNVESCIRSGSNKNIVAINYNDGGFVSKEKYNHNIDKLYSPNKIKILHYVFKLKVESLKNIDFNSKDAKEILEDLLVYTYNQTGIKLKSYTLLSKIV